MIEDVYPHAMEQKKIGDLNSYVLFPQSEDHYPQNAVILVHGYGANGRDLISIGQEWALDCPDTLFIAPDAPDRCELAPMGHQWFSLDNYTREAMEKEISTAWKILSKFIDDVMDEYSLTENKIILMGFSQGTMMALHAALMRKNPCAGVLGYSGRLLINKEQLDTIPHKKMPIHLIHGSADLVVSVDEWEDAMAILKDNKYNITGYKTKGLGHGIDITGIESGLYFIKENLYP